MINFKDFLLERRTNIEDNPKISAYEILKKYKNDDDIYISFTIINKVGINPKSDFNTPNGIYCYPIKEIWKKYNIDIQQSVGEVVPFGGDRPYIQVLRLVNDDGFINDMYYDYKIDNYDRDISKLKDLVDDNVDELNDIIESSNTKSRLTNKPIGRFWFITREIAINKNNSFNMFGKGELTMRWNNILRQLGYTGFADKSGKGIIHPSEPLQAVFLSIKPVKWIEMVNNKDYDKSKVDTTNKDIWLNITNSISDDPETLSFVSNDGFEYNYKYKTQSGDFKITLTLESNLGDTPRYTLTSWDNDDLFDERVLNKDVFEDIDKLKKMIISMMKDMSKYND